MDRTITAMQVQKRNPNRINIFLDGEFGFGVSRIVAAWLKVGQLLSDEKIREIQQDETNEAAFQNALKVLSYRLRSVQEVQKKLRENGFDETVIDYVLRRLKDNNLLGDQEFARAWIENRSVFRPRSQRLMALELRQKGVSDEVVQNALADSLDDETLAYQSAIQHAHRLKGLEWPEFRKKLVAFLMRRGFSFGIADPIVRQVWNESTGEAGDAQPLLDEDEKKWD